MAVKYKRVLIKVSGEALAGEDRFGVNAVELEKVARQIKEIREQVLATILRHCRIIQGRVLVLHEVERAIDVASP